MSDMKQENHVKSIAKHRDGYYWVRVHAKSDNLEVCKRLKSGAWVGLMQDPHEVVAYVEPPSEEEKS